MGLTEFLFTAATVAVVLLGVLGLRVAVTFDYNRYRESRRKEREEQLRMLCTHTAFREERFESLFVSPSGSPHWRCERCGLEVASENTVHEIMNKWARNPKGWVKREKKLAKRARKLYRM